MRDARCGDEGAMEQAAVSFEYGGKLFQNGLRLDLLVERCVVLEVKSVETLAPVPLKQLLTYLRLLDVRVGLLLIFGAPTFKVGLKRVVNQHNPFVSSWPRVKPDPLTQSDPA